MESKIWVRGITPACLELGKEIEALKNGTSIKHLSKLVIYN